MGMKEKVMCKRTRRKREMSLRHLTTMIAGKRPKRRGGKGTRILRMTGLQKEKAKS